jgi:hypothetical protein
MAKAKPVTKIKYEVCTDHSDFGPFESCGTITDDLREAVRELKRERKQRPWAYIARHAITKLGAIGVGRLELQLKRKKQG